MKAEPVAKTPGLFRRGAVWWLGVMIPLELQPAHEGRTKIVRSLGTSDRREAGLLADTARAESQQGFANLRRALNPRPVVTLQDPQRSRSYLCMCARHQGRIRAPIDPPAGRSAKREGTTT